MRRSCLNWWKSGGPAAGRKNAVRTTTATARVVMAIRTVRRERSKLRKMVPHPLPPPPKAATLQVPDASNVIAVAAATMSSESPARARPLRPMQRRRPRVRPSQVARTDSRPPRERFEGKGNENRRDKDKDGGARPEKFGGDRNKGDRNKGDRDRGGRDKGRDFGGRDKGGRDKRDSGPSHRQYATSASPRDRDRPIDPNSPFAKLAALKEQLAGNRKD